MQSHGPGSRGPETTYLLEGMELILSVASFASFVALVAAWAAIPSGVRTQVAAPTHQTPTAQVVAAH